MYQSSAPYGRYKRPRILKTIAITIAVLLPVLLLGSWFWYESLIDPRGSGNLSYELTVDEGDTHSQISRKLADNNIISSNFAYKLQARLQKDNDIIAGTYNVNDGQSVRELISLFDSGSVVKRLVTILPASRLSQIRAGFIEQGYSTDEIDAALDPVQYQGHPALENLPREASLEGYLYPESFQVTAKTPLSEVVRLSLDEMSLLLSPERKAGIRAQGLTVHEGIILASIVEEEVSELDDKPFVAQVFLKRLKEDIPLGSDPTARYGASLVGLEETVFADTPYNTRTNGGLPPTPISNISASSLDAVISPADTEYLYFVSGDDGTTHFSFTLEQHEQKTRQYCKELCRL